MNGHESAHALRRLLRFSLLSAEQWDRYKYLRGILVLAMTICTVGSAVGWYQVVLAMAQRERLQPSGLWGLILLTSMPIIILVAVPKKWELITLSVGLTFILSILGTILRRVPLGVGLEIVLVTGALYFGCVYIGEKHKRRETK